MSAFLWDAIVALLVVQAALALWIAATLVYAGWRAWRRYLARRRLERQWAVMVAAINELTAAMGRVLLPAMEELVRAFRTLEAAARAAGYSLEEGDG